MKSSAKRCIFGKTDRKTSRKLKSDKTLSPLLFKASRKKIIYNNKKHRQIEQYVQYSATRHIGLSAWNSTSNTNCRRETKKDELCSCFRARQGLCSKMPILGKCRLFSSHNRAKGEQVNRWTGELCIISVCKVGIPSVSLSICFFYSPLLCRPYRPDFGGCRIPGPSTRADM